MTLILTGAFTCPSPLLSQILKSRDKPALCVWILYGQDISPEDLEVIEQWAPSIIFQRPYIDPISMWEDLPAAWQRVRDGKIAGLTPNPNILAKINWDTAHVFHIDHRFGTWDQAGVEMMNKKLKYTPPASILPVLVSDTNMYVIVPAVVWCYFLAQHAKEVESIYADYLLLPWLKQYDIPCAASRVHLNVTYTKDSLNLNINHRSNKSNQECLIYQQSLLAHAALVPFLHNIMELGDLYEEDCDHLHKLCCKLVC